MLTDVCTVYNHDCRDGVDCYQSFVLPGVYWECGTGSRYARNSVQNDNQLLLVIPCDSPAAGAYLPPAAWLALADKSGHWTLRQGDLLVYGAQNDQAAQSGNGLRQRFDQVYAVNGVADYSHVAGGLAHWEVRGR